MPIYKGNRANPTAIYFGDSSIGKVYNGDSLVWQKETTTLANSIYGLMYTWYVVSDARNIAPVGWHVPTLTEWETMITELGGRTVAGGHLKEIGLTHWNTPNAGADNSSGFTGRGGNFRYGTSGTFFVPLKDYAVFWTSTEINSNTANNKGLHYSAAVTFSNSGKEKNCGYSLRLIKDDSTDPGTMTDNNGFVYPTVKIGNQVWMAANLKTTKYRTGDDIPEVTGNAAWAALTTGALCAYNNDWGNV